MWFKMNPWVLPVIMGGIGLVYLVFNVSAIFVSKKEKRFISGIPFVGGIHILIAGLISPVKWLALFCVLDCSFWSFLYAVFVLKAFRKDEDTDKK